MAPRQALMRRGPRAVHRASRAIARDAQRLQNVTRVHRVHPCGVHSTRHSELAGWQLAQRKAGRAKRFAGALHAAHAAEEAPARAQRPEMRACPGPPAVAPPPRPSRRC
jgi:hypothetical protein